MDVRILLLALAVSACCSATPDPEEIVRRSVDAIQSDWEQAAKYSYLERDVESKRHSPPASRTYRVLMIDGSPYNLVTALHDQPRSSVEVATEQRKFEREIERRHKESNRER